MQDDPLLQKIQERRLAQKIAARRAGGAPKGAASAPTFGSHGFASPGVITEPEPTAEEFRRDVDSGSSSAATPTIGQRLGRQAKLIGRDIAEGVGDAASMVAAPFAFNALDPMSAQKAAGIIARPVARGLEAVGAPQPNPGLEEVLHRGLRGAVSTGGVGGPLVALSGATGAMGADIAAQAGGGIKTQIAAGAIAGLLPSVATRLVLGRLPQVQAAGIMEDAMKANDAPGMQNVMETGVPDRVERSLALRVAGQGGAPADRLGANAAEQIAAYEAQKGGIQARQRLDITRVRDTQRQGMAGLRQEEATVKSLVKHREGDALAGLREREVPQVVAAKEAGKQAVSMATRNAAPDPVATIFQQTTGTPEMTLLQAETRAKAHLQNTGERVFAPLKMLGEIEPGEHSAPLFDAIGQNPLISEVLDGFLGKSGHRLPGQSMALRREPGLGGPTVDELQRTYRELGIRGTQAARNAGSLNGVHMSDYFAARDQLGDALEHSVPGFREANREYRAAAVQSEALAMGYGDGPLVGGAEPADMRQRMATLHDQASANGLYPERGDAAVEAYQFGQRRRIASDLRDAGLGSQTRDVATPILEQGSTGEERLRIAFPSDQAFRTFHRELSDRSGEISRAQRNATISEEMVTGMFRDKRSAIKDEAQGTLQQVGQEFQDRREAARQAASDLVASIRTNAEGEIQNLPAEKVRLAREIEAKARQLDVPNAGRALKGAVETGVGARARGLVDIIFGLFGKKSDPEKARNLLTDYLLAEGEDKVNRLGRMAGAARAKRLAIPHGIAAGAATATAQGINR